MNRGRDAALFYLRFSAAFKAPPLFRTLRISSTNTPDGTNQTHHRLSRSWGHLEQRVLLFIFLKSFVCCRCGFLTSQSSFIAMHPDKRARSARASHLTPCLKSSRSQNVIIQKWQAIISQNSFLGKLWRASPFAWRAGRVFLCLCCYRGEALQCWAFPAPSSSSSGLSGSSSCTRARGDKETLVFMWSKRALPS